MNTEPIFGREDELVLLNKAYQEAAQFGGGYVFISGDAGMGKTHLLNSFSKQIDKSGVITAYVQCSSMSKGEELYKPCNDLVNMLQFAYNDDVLAKGPVRWLSKINLEKILDIGSELMGIIPGVELAGTAIKVVLAVKNGKDPKEMDEKIKEYKNDRVKFYIDTFLGMSMIKPLIIFIDDLHWADAGTLAVIRNLYQEMAEPKNTEKIPRILIVNSMREIESKISGEDIGLNKMISFMQRYNLRKDAPLFRNINLIPLNELIMGSLLTYELDNSESLSLPLKSWVIEKSGGNPLILKIYIESLKHNGVIFLNNGIWSDAQEVSKSGNGVWVTKGALLAAEKAGAFSKKTAITLEVLRDLSEQQQQLIYYSTVQGDKFSTNVLAHILDMHETRLLWELNKLEKVGFIQRIDIKNNGLENEYWFKLKSQALRESILQEMLPLQLEEVEAKIADYLAKKIEIYKQAIERLDEFEIEEEVGERIELIKNQKSKIMAALSRNTWETSIHYENSKNYINAALYAIDNLKIDIDRLEDMQYDFPSPNEKETLREKIDQKKDRIEFLIDTALSNILKINNENKEKLIDIRIKLNVNLANFNNIIGEYSTAKKHILEAVKLSYLTSTLSDEIQIYSNYINIHYDSGDSHESREGLKKIIQYLDNKFDDIDKNTVFESLISISEHLYYETYAVANKHYNNIVELANRIDDYTLDFVMSKQLLNEIKYGNYLGCRKIFKQIIDKNDNDLAILVDDFDRIASEIRLVSIEDGNYLEFSSDILGEPLENPCDTYLFNWRILGCKVLLEFMTILSENLAKYQLSPQILAQLHSIMIDLLSWLKVNSITPDITELDDDNYIKYVETMSAMITIRSNLQYIYNQYINSPMIKTMLFDFLDLAQSALGKSTWAYYATQNISNWPEIFSLEKANHIYESLLEYTADGEDEETDDILIYSCWADYLFYYSDNNEYIEEIEKLKKLLIDKVIPGKQNDPAQAANIYKEIIIYKYFTHNLWNEDKESIIEKCFDLYLQSGNFEEAHDLIDISHCNEWLSNQLYKKMKKIVEQIWSDAEEINMVKNAEKIIEMTSDSVGSLDDFYVRLRKAQQCYKLAQEVEDDESILKYLNKACELIHEDDQSLAFLDDVFTAISDFWMQSELVPDRKLNINFGLNIFNDHDKQRCYESLYYSFKALNINIGLNNYKRVYEEYTRINKINTENFDSVNLKDKRSMLKDIMGDDADYVEKWISMIYEKGLIEEAIHTITDRFYQFDGYRIDDPKLLEVFNPEIDIKMAQVIVKYLIDNGYGTYVDAYKIRLEGYLFENEAAERILAPFSDAVLKV